MCSTIRQDAAAYQRTFLSASIVCATLLFLFTLAGCGANGTYSTNFASGSGSPSGGGSNGGGGGTGGGGGGGSAAVTWTQRNVVMDAVGNMLAGMNPTGDHDAQNKQLAAFAKTQPGVKNATVDEGQTVTVVFNDGSQFTVINNRILAASKGVSPQAAFATRSTLQSQFSPFASYGSASRGSSGRAVEGFPDLPQSKKAVLLQGMGPGWDSQGDLEAIGRILSKGNYEVQTPVPTIENLMTLAGPGVVYFNTHGGPVYRKRDGLRSVSLWTASNAPKNDSEYTPQQKQWVDEGLIAPMVAVWGWLDGKAVSLKRWAITERFIKTYWKLDRNSIFMADACISGDFQMGSAMQEVCSAYLGWDNFMNTGKPAEYLFDRLVGANSYLPEDPDQRPFDLDSVLKDMENRKINRNGYTAKLEYYKGYLGNFGLLAPTIKNMAVNEFDKVLKIYGLFGDEPDTGGIVSVGGKIMSNRTWTPFEIDIKNFPSSASGDVFVTVRNHKSNVAQLTDWKWPIRYYWKYQGDEQVFGTIDIHFRADVRAYRKEPHEDPVAAPVEFDVAPDTKAHFAASGSYTSGGVTYTWKGTSDPPLVKTQQSTGLVSLGTVDPNAHTLELVLVVGTKDLTVVVTTAGGGTGSNLLPLSTDPLQESYHGLKPYPALKVQLGNDLTIPSGQWSQMGPEGIGTAKFIWDKVTPTSLPNPNSARSIRIK